MPSRRNLKRLAVVVGIALAVIYFGVLLAIILAYS